MPEAVGERVGRLLDFLQAFDAQRHPPVHDIASYDLDVLRAGDLPLSDDVQLRPGAAAWLTVGFVDLPAPPEVPEPHVWFVGRTETLSPLNRPAVTLDEAADDYERQRAQQAEEWVSSVWEPWAREHAKDAAAKHLHRRLFEMRERLTNDRGGVELVWGFGRLLWRPEPDVLVDHPALTVAVEIAVDPVDQRLTVTPSGPVVVESSYASDLTLDDFGAFKAIRATVEASSDGLDPWDQPSMIEIVRRLARSIDHDGTASADDPVLAPATDVLRADLSWVLYLRRPNPDYQGYLDAMRDLYREGVEPPDPFKTLVLDAPSAVVGTLDGDPGEGSQAVTVVDPPLLPLPTNEEQLRILTMSQLRSGVTVQGPPGTGKSHTIANIISHYVAYGKRVLVVAEKEQPLQVLRDKVPAGIRDLTVAVLGADAASRQQLEASINAIQSKVSGVDRKQADEMIDRLTHELRDIDRRTAHLTGRLLDSRAAETERRPLKSSGVEHTPSDAARFVAQHTADLGYIPDELSFASVPPLAPAELRELVGLHREVGLARAGEALLDLPDPSALPTGVELARAYAQLEGHDGELQRAQPELRDLARADAADPATFVTILGDLEREQALANRCAGIWLERVGAQTEDSLLAGSWTDFVNAVGADRQQLLTLVNDLAPYEVAVPENPVPAVVEALRRAQTRLASNGKLGVFAGEAKDAVRGCVVDGRTPTTAEEVRVCLDAIRRNQLRRQLTTRWSNQVGRVEGPSLPTVNPEDHVGAFLADLEQVVGSATRIDVLRRRLDSVGVAAPARPSAEQLGRLADVVGVAQQRTVARSALGQLQLLGQELAAGALGAGASPCWNELERALTARHTASWDEARHRVVGLRGVATRARRLADLHKRLAAGAPRWAKRIAEDPSHAHEPDDIGGAWQWRQLETWVRKVGATDDPAEIQRQLESLSVERRRLVAQIVVERAWRRMADHIGDRERRALNTYLTAVKRYGKTGGKFAARWLAEIRTALNDSKDCIPVWIMTVNRALTSFRPSATPPFDVLIIDEASQIGLEGLPLLALAKTAIVVGDDKQTSPENVGIDQQGFFNLLDQHLSTIPSYRTLFDLNASLYDIAFQKFPGEIMLTEHFRCLPEIIQFSNRYVYNDRIVPLRDQMPRPGWQPVAALHVSDGYKSGRDVNHPEAEAVVDLIEKLCADPDYDGMDFGVVTLLGNSQSKVIWEKLYERLGPDLMTERRVRCGEPANFQGDERDVIVLSLVAAGTADNPVARIGALTGNAAIRRINVAASRAREQMWVVHSVGADRFPAGDLRSALIRHCTEPRSLEATLERLAEQCDSEFERLVVGKILARGYRRVRVQHEVGRYRIDIVVESANARLAVECDGDRWHGPDMWRRDRDRQTVLERAGWTFERIRGSAYFRDPDGALQPLWLRLESLGILPDVEDTQSAERQASGLVQPAVLPPPLLGAVAWPSSPPNVRGAFPPPAPLSAAVPPPTLPPPPPPLAPAAPLAEPSFIDGTNSQLAQSQSPPGPLPPSVPKAQTAPTPYLEWVPRALPDVSTATADQLVDALCEIVAAEGPVRALRAYQLLVRAAGGQRVGREVHKLLNRAAASGLRQGRLAQIVDVLPGQADKTLYVPHTDAVIVRTLGPRQLIDVPRSEINTLVEMLGLEGPRPMIHRGVLEALGLTRLTDRTSAFLDECVAYRWAIAEADRPS